MNSTNSQISDHAHSLQTHSKLSLTNIRGLNSNIDSVHQYLQSSSPLILFLTETQISPSADTTHLQFPDYFLHPLFWPKAGVCAYIHKSVATIRLSHLDHSCRDFQLLWLKLRFPSFNHYFCLIYRSPNSSDSSLFDLLSASIESLLEVDPNCQQTILGDFNVHNRDWLTHSAETSPLGREAESFALINNLSQMIDFPTRVPDRVGDCAHTLDLILTSIPSFFSPPVALPPLGSSDHCLITLSIQLPRSVPHPPSRRTFWRYVSADWDSFRDFLASYPWNDCCFTPDLSTTASNFADVILQGMHLFIPHCTKPGKPQSPEWFNHACCRAVRAKNTAFRHWRMSPTPQSRHCFVQARNKCSSTIQRAKELYVRRKAEKLASSPTGSRTFWSLAKAVSRNFCPSNFPPISDSSGNLVSEPLEKAEVFASQFSSNSNLCDSSLSPPTFSAVGHPFLPVFTTRMVRQTLQSLDINKPPGPDGIPPIVLKMCAPELAPLLRRLFCLSLQSSTFPNSWKNAAIFPIPKRGDPSDPNNYRPISLTSAISKVMETIFADQLRTHLEREGLLSDRQYGFRPRRSTGDLLALVSHRWSASLDSHGESHLVSLDISKAFDRVWHQGLLAKLPMFGFTPALVSWTSSFLANRTISVRVDGTLSHPLPVNAGVPQGSVLSPVLFLLFINDLLSLTSNPIHAFADDATIHCSLSYNSSRSAVANIDSDRSALTNSLSSDLEHISRWGSDNRVLFNASKTSLMSVSLKHSSFSPPLHFESTPLCSTNSCSLLGLSLQSSLSWSPYISTLAIRASRKVGFLFRAKRFYTPNHLLLLYKAQIRPTLEYCSHVWGGASSSSLSLLDRVQRKAIRLINDSSLTSNLQSLAHRRAVASLSLFYRYYFGFCSFEIASSVPIPLTFTRQSRAQAASHPYQVSIARCRTTGFQSSFFPRTAKLWNTLPLSVFPPLTTSNYSNAESTS